jgi:hypothetical protein
VQYQFRKHAIRHQTLTEPKWGVLQKSLGGIWILYGFALLEYYKRKVGKIYHMDVYEVTFNLYLN